jgi:hypothetical protein
MHRSLQSIGAVGMALGAALIAEPGPVVWLLGGRSGPFVGAGDPSSLLFWRLLSVVRLLGGAILVVGFLSLAVTKEPPKRYYSTLGLCLVGYAALFATQQLAIWRSPIGWVAVAGMVAGGAMLWLDGRRRQRRLEDPTVRASAPAA